MKLTIVGMLIRVRTEFTKAKSKALPETVVIG